MEFTAHIEPMWLYQQQEDAMYHEYRSAKNRTIGYLVITIISAIVCVSTALYDIFGIAFFGALFGVCAFYHKMKEIEQEVTDLRRFFDIKTMPEHDYLNQTWIYHNQGDVSRGIEAQTEKYIASLRRGTPLPCQPEEKHGNGLTSEQASEQKVLIRQNYLAKKFGFRVPVYTTQVLKEHCKAFSWQ